MGNYLVIIAANGATKMVQKAIGQSHSRSTSEPLHFIRALDHVNELQFFVSPKEEICGPGDLVAHPETANHRFVVILRQTVKLVQFREQNMTVANQLKHHCLLDFLSGFLFSEGVCCGNEQRLPSHLGEHARVEVVAVDREPIFEEIPADNRLHLGGLRAVPAIAQDKRAPLLQDRRDRLDEVVVQCADETVSLAGEEVADRAKRAVRLEPEESGDVRPTDPTAISSVKECQETFPL
jgi:hypothetical protein